MTPVMIKMRPQLTPQVFAQYALSEWLRAAFVSPLARALCTLLDSHRAQMPMGQQQQQKTNHDKQQWSGTYAGWLCMTTTVEAVEP